jgi:hypothetical protein
MSMLNDFQEKGKEKENKYLIEKQFSKLFFVLAEIRSMEWNVGGDLLPLNHSKKSYPSKSKLQSKFSYILIPKAMQNR